MAWPVSGFWLNQQGHRGQAVKNPKILSLLKKCCLLHWCTFLSLPCYELLLESSFWSYLRLNFCFWCTGLISDLVNFCLLTNRADEPQLYTRTHTNTVQKSYTHKALLLRNVVKTGMNRVKAYYTEENRPRRSCPRWSGFFLFLLCHEHM